MAHLKADGTYEITKKIRVVVCTTCNQLVCESDGVVADHVFIGKGIPFVINGEETFVDICWGSGYPWPCNECATSRESCGCP